MIHSFSLKVLVTVLNMNHNYEVKTKMAQKSLVTSLKIFKHYKLKPSFSIIKDEKAKDKVGHSMATANLKKS